MSTPVSGFIGALQPGTRLHEYEVQRVLGHGGFGITYLVVDRHLEKTVAIKEYLPTDLAARASESSVTIRSEESREAFAWGKEQFLKEARVLARFSHPNLIQVHRFFEANDTAYFVMEFADGVPLDDVLKAEGTLSEQRIRSILLPVLSGLEQVHRGGVLHRDIKPGNIMLRHDGSPVLIDFGAARQNLSSRTRSVMSVLTAGYAPLEQYATSSDQGPWTDLYALGAVAYRALSGKRPTDAVNRVRDDPLVPATLAGQGRYSAAFLAAVDWALMVNPEDRPRSVADWRLALDGQLTPPAVRRAAPSAAPAAAPPAQPASGSEATEVLTRATPRAASPAPGSEGSEATEVLTRARAVAPPAPAEPVREPALRTFRMPQLSRRTLVAGGCGLLALIVIGIAVLGMGGGDDGRSPPKTAAPAASPPPTPATPPAAPGSGTAVAPVQEALQSTSPAPDPAPAAPAKPKPRPAAPQKPALVPVTRMAALATFQDCPRCPAMVALPPGSFVMGASGAGANRWEGPPRSVTIAAPFAIGRAEVTIAEWRACITAGACRAPAQFPQVDVLPVTHVSWSEARAYARWLSHATGRTYRLPSEAEWEYAARAGTATSRYWGDDRTGQCEHANGADVAARAYLEAGAKTIDCNDGYAAIAPIARFKPNAFALHDMSGNAWEWTLDCWADSYEGAPANGKAHDADGCAKRVIRGGSWRVKPESLRSAGRGLGPQDHRSDDLGFRVVAE